MMLMVMATAVMVLAVVAQERGSWPGSVQEWPKAIPRRDRVRRDRASRQEVSTGRLELLGGLSAFALGPNGEWAAAEDRVTLKEFRAALQCAEHEPGLAHMGVLSLLQMRPLTRNVTELVCAMAEVKGLSIGQWGRVRWEKLRDLVTQLKRYSSDAKSALKLDPEPNQRLLRVKDGRLYYDWPWDLSEQHKGHRGVVDRYEFTSQYGAMRVLGAALEMISDIPDSVFGFLSFDYPLLPPNVPFPSFNMGSSILHSEMPYPWSLVANDEIVMYALRNSTHRYRSVTDLHSDLPKRLWPWVLSPHNDSLWHSRLHKASFLGTLWFTKQSVSRQIALDLARQRPDLIDAAWTVSLGSEDHFPAVDEGVLYNSSTRRGEHHEGYLKTIEGQRLKERIDIFDTMRSYKYLVVLSGQSNSGRLLTFLAHSGAVVLLQELDIVYHFQSRLRPWVHYVPLSYSAADLAEKIEWLRQNDDLARQIARNGWAFGKSYLRLEDHYCYAARALEEVGRRGVRVPEALLPFKPKLLPPGGGRGLSD